MTPEQAKAALRTRLGHAPRSKIWDLLVDDRYVQEYLDGDGTIDDLAARYRRVEGVLAAERSGDGQRQQVTELGPDQRLEVLARLVADAAADEPAVRSFREKHLAGRLLDATEMRRWLQAKAPPGAHGIPADPDDEALTDAGPNDVPESCVRFFLPSKGGADGGELVARRTGTSTVLRQLRRLATRLAARTRWDEWQTTTFIVTGRQPTIPRIRMELGTWYAAWSYHALGVRRMEMSVHPGTSPTELARFYRQARSQIMPARLPRVRKAGRSRAAVLAFVRARPQLTWPQRRAEWDQAYPDLAYTNTKNLQRDYAKALRLAQQEESRESNDGKDE